jgi:FAD:protein FMN transferase
MPLVESLPVADGCAQWSVWGTVARIVVTEPRHLLAAEAIVRSEINGVDEACSRFRTDSELERAARLAGRPTMISERLAELLETALIAARDTGGDVDPTLGTALVRAGYDRDFDEVAAGPDRDLAATAQTRRPEPAGYHRIDWQRIHLDGRMLTIPAQTRLDLGATAKAWTADRCADLVANRCGTGVLVALGGDIATAGPAADGWDILVQDGPNEPACGVTIPAGAAIATSSTITRRWTDRDRTMHHILDPRSGEPAAPVWRTVSVVADTCVAANTASTAAIVQGERALDRLRSSGLAARLVDASGSVVTVGGWPAESDSG